MTLYQRFLRKPEFGSYEDFLHNFRINVPENFNFAYDVVDEIACLEPNRRAMVWCNVAGEERVLTFGEMKLYSDKCAQMLADHGVKKGDMVLLVLKRHYEFWFTVLALHKLGAVGVPATNLLTTHDLVYRFEAAGITACVCSGECNISEYVDEACRQYDGVHSKFIVRGRREGWLTYSEELEKYDGNFERVQTSRDDPLLLYFTSGTTGMPKMVVHNHAYPVAHIITARYWHNVHSDDLHLTVSETGWMKAVWGKLYGQWFAAASIFVYDFDKFVPHDLLHMMEKYKVTTFCAPPTMFRFMLQEDVTKFDLSSIHHCCIAGEPLNPEVFKKWHELTGLKLYEGFGQSESSVMLANFQWFEPIPGSTGKPSPLYDIQLISQEGNVCEDGEEGTIAVMDVKNHPPVGLFTGYYLNEEMTKEKLGGQYYDTGDVAWRDSNGYYWFVGRNDDVIKCSGYRIGPFEVESALVEHPAVVECAITGTPDPIRGQVVKATVVLAKGYEGTPELTKELQNYVKKATAPYKYPRVIEYVDELPKTIGGKIKRAEIRKADES